MIHWASNYIGKPWQAGARGPQAYDCYGLAVAVQRDHYRRDLPLVEGVDASDRRAVAVALAIPANRGGWAEIPAAQRQDGDLVLMAHARHPAHIGIWLAVDGGGILHCVRGPGVVFSKASTLASAGWGHLEFYQSCV